MREPLLVGPEDSLVYESGRLRLPPKHFRNLVRAGITRARVYKHDRLNCAVVEPASPDGLQEGTRRLCRSMYISRGLREGLGLSGDVVVVGMPHPDPDVTDRCVLEVWPVGAWERHAEYLKSEYGDMLSEIIREDLRSKYGDRFLELLGMLTG